MMHRLTELGQFPSGLPKPIVTIGNFDGVHLGHRQILEQVITDARATQGTSVVITFDPHPLHVLLPEISQPLIMTPSQKLEVMEALGIEFALVLKFDNELARWSPRHFVERIVVQSIHAHKVYVGSNFIFGYQQRGNVETLKNLGREFGFLVEGVPQFTWRQTRVSSTLIRGFLREGKVQDANRLLGRFYTLVGLVIQGAGRGRTQVVPTLNLSAENELIPKTGVYITQTMFNGQAYRSVTNIGFRPTFNEKKLSIETHLLDTQLASPPNRIEISFLHRLRDEQKFQNADELRRQIAADISDASKFFDRWKRFANQEGDVHTGRGRDNSPTSGQPRT